MNSTFAVILPAISTPFLILLFRQASRSFPHEIIEAARLDGLRELAIFVAHLPADDEADPRRRGRHHLHGRVEQLPVAEGDPRRQRRTRPCRCCCRTSAPGTSPTTGCLMLAVLIASLPAMVDLPGPAAQLRRGHHGSHQVTFDARPASPTPSTSRRTGCRALRPPVVRVPRGGRGRDQRVRAVPERPVEVPLREEPGADVPGFESLDVTTARLGRHPGAGAHPAARLRPPAVHQRPVPVGRSRGRRTGAGADALQPGGELRHDVRRSSARSSHGERLSVSFHGAESAIAVWLNGTYIGYGADSFTPSEFDLTDALRRRREPARGAGRPVERGVLDRGPGLLPVLRASSATSCCTGDPPCTSRTCG